MARLTEKEVKALGFDTTNHIGGFPIDVRMLFVGRYNCNGRLSAAVIDRNNFKDPDAAKELKKYLLDKTLIICKKYIERFGKGDQEKVDYLRDCVQNRQMYFLSEADIDNQFKRSKFNPKNQTKDNSEVSNVGIKVVPKVSEKKERVSSFINNHNPNVKDIPESVLEWQDAEKSEIQLRLNYDYIGKHEKMSYPSLEAFYCKKLFNLYNKGHLDPDLIEDYVEELNTSEGEQKLLCLRKLTKRMYTIMDKSFRDGKAPGLSIELDRETLLFDTAKKVVTRKWREIIEERKNKEAKQEKYATKAEYVGKHMKSRDRLVLEGLNVLSEEPEEPVLRKAESLIKEESAEREINIEDFISKFKSLKQEDEERVSSFAQKIILNPKASGASVARNADILYRQAVGENPLAKENKNKVANRFNISYEYKTAFDKLNEIKKEYDRAVESKDGRAIAIAKSNFELKWKEFDEYANTKGNDGVSNRDIAINQIGRLQAVYLADRMLEGKKVDGKKYKSHEVFNIIDKKDKDVAKDYMKYTVNYEKNKHRPLKRLVWTLSALFGSNNSLYDFQEDVRQDSLLGKLGVLEYKGKNDHICSPQLDVHKAKYINNKIFRGFDITKEEILNIVKKRERNEIER